MEANCSADLFSHPHFTNGLYWACQETVFEVLLKLHAFLVIGLQPWSLAVLNFCGSIQLCGIFSTRKLRSAGLSLTPVDIRQNCTQALIGTHKFQFPNLLDETILPFKDFCLRRTQFYTRFVILRWWRQSGTCQPARLGFVSLAPFPGGRFSMQSDNWVFAFFRCTSTHVFYKSKSRAEQCAL